MFSLIVSAIITEKIDALEDLGSPKVNPDWGT